MSEPNSTVNTAPSSPASPATFAEAFAAETSSASDSQSQSADAAAAVQPATDGEGTTTPAEDDRSPFIPRPRFDEVNSKYNELKQWREQYAWAEQVNREQLQQVIAAGQKYQTDPLGYVQELIAELQAHPEHGAKLRSLAAKALSQGRGQQPRADLDRIVIDIGNGETVSLADLKQSWLNEVRSELEPVRKTVQQVEQERAHLAANQFASSTFEQLSKLPGFTDHAKEIGTRLAALNLQTDDPQVLTLAVKAIYTDLVTPKREAELTSKAQSQLLDNLQQKAAASTSVNPGNAAPATSSSPKSFYDLPAEAWK